LEPRRFQATNEDALVLRLERVMFHTPADPPFVGSLESALVPGVTADPADLMITGGTIVDGYGAPDRGRTGSPWASQPPKVPPGLGSRVARLPIHRTSRSASVT